MEFLTAAYVCQDSTCVRCKQYLTRLFLHHIHQLKQMLATLTSTLPEKVKRYNMHINCSKYSNLCTQTLDPILQNALLSEDVINSFIDIMDISVWLGQFGFVGNVPVTEVDITVGVDVEFLSRFVFVHTCAHQHTVAVFNSLFMQFFTVWDYSGYWKLHCVGVVVFPLDVAIVQVSSNNVYMWVVTGGRWREITIINTEELTRSVQSDLVYTY